MKAYVKAYVKEMVCVSPPDATHRWTCTGIADDYMQHPGKGSNPFSVLQTLKFSKFFVKEQLPLARRSVSVLPNEDVRDAFTYDCSSANNHT